MKTTKTDFTVLLDGTVFLLQPNTEVATDWVNVNLKGTTTKCGTRQPYWPTVAISWGYIADIVKRIRVAGLSLESETRGKQC